ncbi:MAG TPA: hypothetical protein VHT53_04445 [Candidatus Elarobacter sp.]|jgi:hypothetical protein|nr:hypothetical protein [Candidatus Elarobacter sp.]
MRVLVGALLATLAAGPNLPVPGNLAVAIDARPGRNCAIVSTATITAYDARARAVEVAYRFVRSDGSVSRTGRIALAGDGVVAQSVRDEWTPRGASPWVALEILAPERLRSQRAAAAPRCQHREIAASRLVR